MGKPTICIGENKDADQLRGNREADQRLCFRYSDSTIPLLLKGGSFSYFHNNAYSLILISSEFVVLSCFGCLWITGMMYSM